MRALSFLLCLSISTAFAAPPPNDPSPPPSDAAAPPQDIDVDAMARAKDAGASAPVPASDAVQPTSAQPAAAGEAAQADASQVDSSQDASALAKPAIDPQDKRVATGCEGRATRLLDAAQKGDFATATKDFDAKMRGALTPPKFKEMWNSLAQFGTLQARGQPHPGKGEGYYIVMTPLIFDKANLVSQVACGSDGLIAGFNVKPISVAQ